jgi:hypothetical protein
MSETILVYLGPSLSWKRARQILPDALYRPPAKQGDILSDVVNLNPAYVILIDGQFRDNLSPWHKEIIYALQHPGVKGIYGAASMGALRAAELDFAGMVGIGQIYRWYAEGVTEDDSEVALTYAERESNEGPLFYPQTIPLCDIRAGVDFYTEFPDNMELIDACRSFFEKMASTYYVDRTPKLCEEIWGNACGVSYPRIAQKEIDTVEALSNFRTLKADSKVRLTPDHLSVAFKALYDRDRRITINGQSIPQQHIESYVMLHNPEWERICWDSANQELALMLCNALSVMVSLEEAERESNRFQQRCGIETMEDFYQMLENNGWSRGEYDRLMVQNARIHKLQHALTVAKINRRNTRAILDYLRTHQAFDYWAIQAAQKEAAIAQKGIDDWRGLDLETSVWKMLADHFEAE